MLTRSKKRFDLETAALFAALLTLLFVLAGCAIPAPPLVVPQPAPLLDTAITIRATDGHSLEGAIAELVPDLDKAHPIVGSGFRPGFKIPFALRGTGATLTVTAPDLETRRVRLVIPLSSSGLVLDGGDLEVILSPAFVALPRLEVQAGHFAINGVPYPIIGHSDFNLFARFIAGEDIGPIVRQRLAAGINWFRVFTAFDVCYRGVRDGRPCQEIGRLVPSEHPDYDAQLVAFARLLAKAGARVELVGLTGPYQTTFGNSVDAMVAHWERLIRVGCAETNVQLERVNEFDQAANSLDHTLSLGRFRRPECGVLAAAGSNGNRATPVRPAWGYETYHVSTPEWQRQTGHNCMEFTIGADEIAASHVPCLADENIRYPDNESDLGRARGAAANGVLLSAGILLHTVEGKNSTLWGPVSAAAAVATVEGARSVPPSCMNWTLYEHVAEREGAGVLRFYRVDRNDACVAAVAW